MKHFCWKSTTKFLLQGETSMIGKVNTAMISANTAMVIIFLSLWKQLYGPNNEGINYAYANKISWNFSTDVT